MSQITLIGTSDDNAKDVVMRSVTWGKALMVETADNGGLRHVVECITSLMGSIGTRNTFGKLLSVENPAALKDRDKWRAWVLLAAMDLNPTDWGIPPETVPPAIDGEQLQRRLVAAVKRIKEQPSDYKAMGVRSIVKLSDRPRRRNDTRGPGSRAAA